MERFLRIQRLLGEEGYLRLQSSSVTIVGLGAVGGYVVEGLARAGISSLRLVDFDTIHSTNINRQILALEETIGRPKVAVAQERIFQINPGCQVRPMQLFVRQETMDELLTPAPDLLIDAIDSLNPKVQLLTETFRRTIPVISSMGAALRTDPTKIRFDDISNTKNCPLARRLRRRLRRNGVERGISCVFSTEEVNFTYLEPEEEINPEPFVEERGRKRKVLGSLPTLTGIFGLIIANQAILQLSGITGDKRRG